MVTDSKGYNAFPQINIPFSFSRINHRPLVMWDCCIKCCEIKTVSLTYGSLQVVPWNNDPIIEKIDDWKWCHHITDSFSRYACLKPRMYQNYYDVSLQFLAIVIPVLQANSKFERMHHCNWCFIIQRDLSAYGWLQGNC